METLLLAPSLPHSCSSDDICVPRTLIHIKPSSAFRLPGVLPTTPPPILNTAPGILLLCDHYFTAWWSVAQSSSVICPGSNPDPTSHISPAAQSPKMHTNKFHRTEHYKEHCSPILKSDTCVPLKHNRSKCKVTTPDMGSDLEWVQFRRSEFTSSKRQTPPTNLCDPDHTGCCLLLK